MLDECPQLKILVTSRVRLGLAGEQLLPLEGLPCPEHEDADRLLNAGGEAAAKLASWRKERRVVMG